MADKEKIYPDGLYAHPPRDGAPDFVKGKISIHRDRLGAFLSTWPDEWVNLDVKEGREGKWYAQVNAWKPEGDAPKKKGEWKNEKLPPW